MNVLYFSDSLANNSQISHCKSELIGLMKKAATLLIASLYSVGIMAQSITPEVVSTAGDHYDNGSYQLSWTLGEIAVQTYDNGTNILTEDSINRRF